MEPAIPLVAAVTISALATPSLIMHLPETPVMEQGEPYAVVVAGTGAVSVGSVGAPDNYIPTVWLSPAR